jgi:ribosomal protein S27AE
MKFLPILARAIFMLMGTRKNNMNLKSLNFTEEEQDLFDRLSSPPKCMHPLLDIKEHEKFWECGKCGLIAKKSIEILPGLFII